MIPSTVDRVPRHTRHKANDNIRRQTDESIARTAAAGPAAISQRLAELDREWGPSRG